MHLSERLGDQLGHLIAPVFKRVSQWREARTFHPRGDVARAHVEPLGVGELRPLADALTGKALVRFSNALWKSARWPDALGCAIAFVDQTGAADQHLLFATIRRPWTMPFAPFSTETDDYLGNHYFAVSPFRIPGLGEDEQRWFRLRPEKKVEATASSDWTQRRTSLEREIEHGYASLLLEAGASPWGPWASVARIRLDQLLPEDPPSLTFSPFLDGRGVTPVGFIHALRRGAYAGSQEGRLPVADEPPLRRAA